MNMHTVYIMAAIFTVVNALLVMQMLSKRVIVFQNFLFLEEFNAYVERIFWKAKESLRKSRDGIRGNFCTAQDSELQQLVKKHGFDGLIFMLPLRPVRSVFGLLSYTTSSDEPTVVPCVIENDDRTQFEDGHKVRLRSIYPNYGTERMYLDSLERSIKDGRAKVYKDINAAKELSELRSAWGDNIVAMIRVPERGLIENALKADNRLSESDKIRELLFDSVIDDPKCLNEALRFGRPIAPMGGDRLVESGTHCRLSHLEALERLETINGILGELFPYNEDYGNSRIIPAHMEAEVGRMLKLTESTYLRDPFETEDPKPSEIVDSKVNDELDFAGKVMVAMRNEGVDGLILALRAVGMFSADIAKVLPYKLSRINYVSNVWISKKEEFEWIRKSISDMNTRNWRGYKYTEFDLDCFIRVLSFFTGECDNVPQFDFDVDDLSHRTATADLFTNDSGSKVTPESN